MTGDIKISDIFGIEKPAVKLLDVMSKGLGKFLQPGHIKRIADARQYEYEKIAHISNASGASLRSLEYDQDKLKILYDSGETTPDSVDEFNGLAERAQDRLLHTEIKRQNNIEQTVLHASEELEKEESVTAETLDEDWITKFFRTAEDVSSSNMQMLWGRVLSGEIKKPNSYSLRTLDILKNITSEEAEIFCKFVQLVIEPSGNAFIWDSDALLDLCNITLDEILLMRDIGLIQSDERVRFQVSIPNSKSIVAIKFYDKAFILKSEVDEEKKISLKAHFLTRTGIQLMTLIQKEPNNINSPYIKAFIEHMKTQPNLKIIAGDYVHTGNGNEVKIFNQKEL